MTVEAEKMNGHKAKSVGPECGVTLRCRTKVKGGKMKHKLSLYSVITRIVHV